MSLIDCTMAEGGVARMALQRAPVNALSEAFLGAMSEELRRLAADPEVKAVVLTSPFKVFSAGLDLKEAQGFGLEAQHGIVRALNEDFLALFAFPKPTVAAVNGAAIAGGLFFVLGCDWRIAVPRAQFGLAEVRVGADFPVGPMEIARHSLDPGTLRRLMLTGQPIGAEAAERCGIADEIAEADALEDRAMAKARELAALPPRAYASVKRQIRSDAVARIEAAMAAGANAPEGGWFTEETRPAMQRMIG